MTLDTQTIKDFFENAKGMELRCLMAELDKMQDTADDHDGRHIPIKLTVSLLAELIHKAEIKSQKRKAE